MARRITQIKKESMSQIRKLIEFIASDNIAEIIRDQEDGEDLLKKLAQQVIDDDQRNRDSMIDWCQMVEDGEKIAEQETAPKDEPFPKAANFKSPALLEAQITFGDRAATELLRGRHLIKVDVIGKDPDGIKKQKSENIVEFSNWQLNHHMKTWRSKQEHNFYELSGPGATFKKTSYDDVSGLNRSEMIHYPDFSVNQATSCIEEAKSFTHAMDFQIDDVFEKQLLDEWLDVDLFPNIEEGEGGSDIGSNESEEVICAIDNDQRFLEQNCFFDLNGDERREPYIVTVHVQSKQVVRIVARFNELGIIMQDENKNIISFERTRDDGNNLRVKDRKGNVRPVQESDLKNKLIRVEPIQNIVYYEFIPSLDKTFLGIGYYHLLSALSLGINSATTELINAGKLANLQGGWTARGFRHRMGNLTAIPGEWLETDIPAAELQAGMMPHQFKEPSVVLLNLNEKLNEQIKQLVVNTDLKGVLSPNAPASTTLALIQEAMLPMSAILQRVIRSESEEFKQLFALNAQFIDPLLYQIVLEDASADFRQDFDMLSLDIMPTANPEMSSRMQRIQMSDIMITQAPNIAMTGGDVRAIWESWFDSIGADNMIGQVYPTPEQITAEQQQRLEEQQEQQRIQNQLMMIQIDHAERDQIRKDRETEMKLRETTANIRKIGTEMLLNFEKAQTEDIKNGVNIFNAQVQAITAAVDNTMKELGFENAERLSRPDATTKTIASNNAG